MCQLTSLYFVHPKWNVPNPLEVDSRGKLKEKSIDKQQQQTNICL